MDDLKIAERCEELGWIVAKALFNEYGVALPSDDAQTHVEKVAYAANLFTVAAGIRATLSDSRHD